MFNLRRAIFLASLSLLLTACGGDDAEDTTPPVEEPGDGDGNGDGNGEVPGDGDGEEPGDGDDEDPGDGGEDPGDGDGEDPGDGGEDPGDGGDHTPSEEAIAYAADLEVKLLAVCQLSMGCKSMDSTLCPEQVESQIEFFLAEYRDSDEESSCAAAWLVYLGCMSGLTCANLSEIQLGQGSYCTAESGASSNACDGIVWAF